MPAARQTKRTENYWQGSDRDAPLLENTGKR